MIFDWIENCKQIIQTKHFPNSDGHEKKTMMLQHIILFKYLEDQEKKTREEVKQFWLTTDSIYLTNIPDDDKDKWIDIQFEKLWSMRSRSRLNFIDEKNKIVYNFPIYQEEIDYINSLECSTWLKKALLLLLACGKHNKNGFLKYNFTTTAWIERMINLSYKVRDKMYKIGQINMKYHLFDFKIYGGRVNYIKMCFARNRGTVVAVVYSPSFMKDYLDLIQENILECSCCHKKFTPSSKQKTSLCPECYKIKRKKDKLEYIRKKRDVDRKNQLSLNDRGEIKK